MAKKRRRPEAPAAPERWLTTAQAWRLIYAANGGPTWASFCTWVDHPSRAPAGFPRPFKVPGRAGKTWDRDQVERWIEERGAAASARAAAEDPGPEATSSAETHPHHPKTKD